LTGASEQLLTARQFAHYGVGDKADVTFHGIRVRVVIRAVTLSR